MNNYKILDAIMDEIQTQTQIKRHLYAGNFSPYERFTMLYNIMRMATTCDINKYLFDRANDGVMEAAWKHTVNGSKSYESVLAFLFGNTVNNYSLLLSGFIDCFPNAAFFDVIVLGKKWSDKYD